MVRGGGRVRRFDREHDRLGSYGTTLGIFSQRIWLLSHTQWPNLFDVHLETAVPLLLVLGTVLFERERTKLFVFSAVLACSFKEDGRFVYAMWGVVLWLEWRRWFDAALTSGAAAWTVLAFTVAIPAEGGNLA